MMRISGNKKARKTGLIITVMPVYAAYSLVNMINYSLCS